MSYPKSARLPFERASRIGHLEVIQSELVKKLCESFNEQETNFKDVVQQWKELPKNGKPLPILFASDGSIQMIQKSQQPYKTIAFVKTALLKIYQFSIDKIDKLNPNPFELRDIMKDSALYHATAFPLRNVSIEGKTNYEAIREILFESISDTGLHNSLNGTLLETLKWLVYEKWSPNPKERLDKFGCPHCEENIATLELDQVKGKCSGCGGNIFITDMFGLHQSMAEDYASVQVATDYMSVAETLMLLSPIRFFWERNRAILKQCLFVKDGPLYLRATLAKLAAPIRRFFKLAKEEGIEIALIGQEKSGDFVEHLEIIGKNAPCFSYFLPDNEYIQNEIKFMKTKAIYGGDTNYGAKIFIKLDEHNKMVLNIPTGVKGEYVTCPSAENLIGFPNIIATIPKILGTQYESSLYPLELVNSIASLSTYPSAKVLELFEDALHKVTVHNFNSY